MVLDSSCAFPNEVWLHPERAGEGLAFAILVEHALGTRLPVSLEQAALMLAGRALERRDDLNNRREVNAADLLLAGGSQP